MENNLKELKDSIVKLLFESVVSQTKNKEYKKFITAVKKSDILKSQLGIYTLVENEKFDNRGDASLFLQESLRKFNNYTVKEIEIANKNIVESFGGLFTTGDDIYNIIIGIYAKDSKINPSYHGKKWKEITNSMVENKALIKESDINDEESSSVTKKVIKRAVQLVNDRYPFLTETERKIFNAFIYKNDADKEAIYNELVFENIKLVKRKSFESDEPELDKKLELIESKLRDDKYDSDKKIDDYIKLLNLNQTLL